MRKLITPLVAVAILSTCAEAQHFPFQRAKRMQAEARELKEQSQNEQAQPDKDAEVYDPSVAPQSRARANPMVHKAAGTGQLNELQFLESKGNSLTAADQDGNTPLHVAAYRGQAEVVKYLVTRPGLLKDPVDKRGLTPLMLAASAGHSQVVQCLLEAGCDPALKSQDGSTALHRAAAQGQLACVEALLAAGCDPKVTDLKNKTPQTVAEEKRKGDWQQVVSALQKAQNE